MLVVGKLPIKLIKRTAHNTDGIINKLVTVFAGFCPEAGQMAHRSTRICASACQKVPAPGQITGSAQTLYRDAAQLGFEPISVP